MAGRMAELGHPSEGLSLADMRSLQSRKLRDQVDYLFEHSDFYRDKLGQAGLRRGDITTVDDLTRVPFTIKEEIRQSLARRPPLGDHIAADPEQVVQFQASTGTTGRPSYVGLTTSDVAGWSEIIRRTFWAQGFRPGDRIIQTLGMSRCWVGGLPVIQGLAALGASAIPAGAEPGTTWLLHAIRDLEPTGLVGTPNFALYLGQQSEEVLGVPARELSVNRIYVGGEPGGGIPSIRNRAQELWGAEMREVMGGTDLVPAMWAECEEQSGMHFLAPEYVLFEIVSLDDQQPLDIENGVVGELVYSHLDRQATPVLRFRHSDIVEVLGTTCTCGRTTPKIRCFGRTDDLFIVKGVNLYPTAIQDIVVGMRPAASGSLKIVKESPDYAIPGPLPLRVERGEAALPADDAALAERVATAVRDLCKVRVEVEIVAFGTYPPPGREKVALIENSYR